LWVDDASALLWMAPNGLPNVEVIHWTEPLGADLLRLQDAPCEVLVEAFGCEVAPEFIAACAGVVRAGGLKPLWFNLEYLSAEAYVERSHGLPSPVQRGPAAGWPKWFFYPGFTRATGGLLRERMLAQEQALFDRGRWLDPLGVEWRGKKLVSLFCYEPTTLPALLRQLAARGLQGQPVRLLVAAGRAETAVKSALHDENAMQPLRGEESLLSISYLPLMPQTGFDRLLWACDLNFVRGEDSAVRALWAARPFVWQIYPQSDQAHQVKLQAFLDMLKAPASLRRFHEAWNADGSFLPQLDPEGWAACAVAARDRLLAQDDLVSQLMRFAATQAGRQA
jgi:uncharacterized repeat protein (TIGR03837 family)